MNLTRTKSVEDILAHTAEPAADEATSTTRLRRRLGPFDLMGFGIGIVIGTGIFTLTGVAAKDSAGPGVVISFALAGFVSLLAALCYAELSSAVPTAGSAYTYAYATIGEIFAWIIGWDLILEFALGAAVVARGWSGYLAELVDSLPASLFGESATVNLGALGITLVLGVVAYVGIRESKWVTNVLVVVKVLVCLFVIVAGAFFVKASNWAPFIPGAEAPRESTSGLTQPLWQALVGVEPSVYGMAGVLSAAAIVFFSYTGFEAVANLGEETRNPKRDLPLGLLGTLLICTFLYVGVSAVLTGMVNYTDINEGAPISSAFEDVGLGWAATLVGIAALAGLTSVILVDLVAMGRIGFAMARDGLLPKGLAKVHPKHGTPSLITLFTVALVAVLAAFVPLTALAEMVSIGTLFAFTIVSLAVPVLRRTRPELPRPFRTPFSPVLPILSAVLCVALMGNLSIETWIRFAVWMALGLVLYFTYGARRGRLAQQEAQAQPASR
ncbi:amino acid permease [Nocardioides mesophilus]|uniref:Amino acid permease n=1 Tax=Nocardioides mesophilus TaxID=433659 RepID=A0A7G9RET5_9ACTN|nr:amino acid permease [Nocardioides mesophilus]QNN54110.1 amino acid permease [Nocardioides mesophilus]